MGRRSNLDDKIGINKEKCMSDLIKAVLEWILSVFAEKQAMASEPVPQAAQSEAPIPKEAGIDWTDPKAMVSVHFSVKECLWLPSWQALHVPSEEEKANILKQAKAMDRIRDFLGAPLNIHCWIRPILNCPSSPHHGQDYNAFVKGAKNSCHKIGLATDYDAKGLNCDNVRYRLESKLEEFGVRMEKMPGGSWVHNDSGEVPTGGHRYFIP
jgi:hypothetical protein